ncbi:hypothetical protein CTI12_AA445490 [Artemisia annua]|uniref:Uncharacterized protein n=1 Tax=Artemisia annua TaxID=35608 RepID=A0A2U1LWH8_ARTAN|nr:hypothetical protein CTI12_AA445490 [Artemisia annua]
MDTTTDFTTPPRRSSYLTGCMSPLCVPVHEEYTLVNNEKRGGDQKRTRWRKLMNKVVKESKKNIYRSSKPVTFKYDAVSYSQNFDDGNNHEEYHMYASRFSRVV